MLYVFKWVDELQFSDSNYYTVLYTVVKYLSYCGEVFIILR